VVKDADAEGRGHRPLFVVNGNLESKSLGSWDLGTTITIRKLCGGSLITEFRDEIFCVILIVTGFV
jgi:hypothetical protein